ncbi:MAG: sensor histidine kinase [Lentisphaerae bacterium]|nr:sensor histidine kinase [Lentisphaerota bacterium]MBT5609254.1 sensor histidine kinase [Lentisphaerota bacterium]MBT7055275.1 sensor histidine kinase [Lentisphaerota bacterium]MBT7847458.1 sensor histidine kinase [Lentisphaerota bacterium]
MTTSLVFALVVTIFLVGLLSGILGNRYLGQTLEAGLCERSESLAAELAAGLAPDVWNLDSASIAAFLEQRKMNPELGLVRVLTEYGDVLVESRFQVDEDLCLSRRGMTFRKNDIGVVEVGLMRHGIQDVLAVVQMTSGVMLILTTLLASGMVYVVVRRLVQRPLTDLMDGVRQLKDGDYAMAIEPGAALELDALAAEFNAMAEQVLRRTCSLEEEVSKRTELAQALADHQNQLEKLVAVRTASLQDANRNLSCEIEARRHAQAAILSAASDEQQRIGRDLHDSLGQQLTAIQFSCRALQKTLGPTGGAAYKRVTQLSERLKAAIGQLRRVSRGLVRVDMSPAEMVTALDHLCTDVAGTYGIACGLQIAGDPENLGHAAPQVYHIAQEAIQNAVRHAGAKEIRVTLSCSDACCRLAVEDDGRGLGAGPSENGVGLRTMRSRAEMVGGSLRVCERDGGGVEVVCELLPERGRAPVAPSPGESEHDGGGSDG